MSGKMLKQHTIWQQVVEGDPKAWRLIVKQYAALVQTVAVRTGLSRDEAEDCAQQTWMALHRSRTIIEDPAKLPGWLVRVASRKASRMLRQKVRESVVIAEAESPKETTLPDEELLRLERYGQLITALAQLDDRCRKLLQAVFLSPEDMSYKDIAEELGIPVNSMGPTRKRCLNKLKKILTEMGYQ